MGVDHIVDDQAHPAFGAIVAGIAAKAAQIERGDSGVLLKRAEIGHLDRVVFQPVKMADGKILAGQGGNRQRHAFQRLGTMARGDHHLFHR